jgi:ceramide glucosyltransferase
VGQLFTHPLPLALAALVAAPEWWPVAAAAAAMRFVSVWVTAGPVLRDPLTRRFWWMLPVQDTLSFGVWIGGFFGNTIVWRGRKYYLLPDGRFELIPSPQTRIVGRAAL